MKKIILVAVICVETFLISLSLLLSTAYKRIGFITTYATLEKAVMWHSLCQQLYTVALALACVTIGFSLSYLTIKRTTLFKSS